MRWFSWPDDVDGTEVVINLDHVQIVNFGTNDEGLRFVTVQMTTGDTASTTDVAVITQLLRETGLL